nr:MAG TPA: hypothetical protein [Caudoviricetes sp.]
MGFLFARAVFLFLFSAYSLDHLADKPDNHGNNGGYQSGHFIDVIYPVVGRVGRLLCLSQCHLHFCNLRYHGGYRIEFRFHASDSFDKCHNHLFVIFHNSLQLKSTPTSAKYLPSNK